MTSLVSPVSFLARNCDLPLVSNWFHDDMVLAVEQPPDLDNAYLLSREDRINK